jgi:hypothetical protein
VFAETVAALGKGYRDIGGSAQLVTDGWAVIRPELGQLEFLCLDWSMSTSVESALVENSRRDRRTEPIVRTVPFILSAEDQGILGLSRKLEK